MRVADRTGKQLLLRVFFPGRCWPVHLCPGILGLGGTLPVYLPRDDFFRAQSGSDHSNSVLFARFLSNRTPVVACTACLVTFLLDPAAALVHHPPWRM